MSITIKDIAKQAKVSHTTVSRALNDSPLINAKTKRRIQRLAEQMGYSPNYSARSLVTLRSYHVGLFFTTLRSGTSPGFLYDTLRGVNQVCKDRYHLVVKGIDDIEQLRTVNARNFDGIVVMSQSEEDDSFITHVKNEGIPIAVLNRPIRENGLINIVSDDAEGAYQAVSYAISAGHRRFAMIEGKPDFRSTAERRNGYLKALQEQGLADRDAWHAVGNYDVESGYRAMQELIQSASRSPEGLPTAIFCGNDEMAVGALKALEQEGIRVPGEVSLIGFDDSMFCAYLTPALTTVKRPIEQIARVGAQKLLAWIEEGHPEEERFTLNAELIVRESVQKRSQDQEGK